LDSIPLPPSDFHPSAVAKAVNVLWFSSLILSLFAALFGIFVKQWLHTYSNWSDVADAREAVLVREFYRSGLKLWHVSDILATLPLLLQLALLFFVAGLVTYLWTLDAVVAGFVSVLVVAGVIVAVVAIILPVYLPRCSYRSPLGLLLVRVLKSYYSSWLERDLSEVRKSCFEMGHDWDRSYHIRAYREMCALLEITPNANGSISKKHITAISNSVNNLEVHANESPFHLLQASIFDYANSQPSNGQPDIVQTMVYVLAALVSGKKYLGPVSVIQGFVRHVAEMSPRVVDSPAAVKELLSSIQALSSTIARYRLTFKMPGLAESAAQGLDCFQQWMSTASAMSGENILDEQIGNNVPNLLRQSCLLSHSTGVLCAAFSPHGGRIVSGSVDMTVRIWDANCGVLLRALQGHTGWVRSIAYSPNGANIVSGSYDHTLRIWDADSGAILQVLQGHVGWVEAVAFSPDGKWIVSGSYDHTLRVWHAYSGIVLRILQGHGSPVLSVAFSPNGKRIVSSSFDWTVRIWDATTGALERTLQGHTGFVKSVAFHRKESALSQARPTRPYVFGMQTLADQSRNSTATPVL
jgi:WD40 repeat protein